MIFFRKKKEQKGKGTDEVVARLKEFDVLNYTPVDYRYTAEYVDFKKNAASDLWKMIEKTAADSLCANMCDEYANARTIQMKTHAKEDYTYHVYVVHHHTGILKGLLLKANSHRENLMQDLESIENEINMYKQIKQQKNIH